MKTYQIHECETCGMRSENFKEIATCEASHLGLTLEESHEWRDLKFAVKSFSNIVHRNANDETRNQLDLAIKKLIEFEEIHNLIN